MPEFSYVEQGNFFFFTSMGSDLEVTKTNKPKKEKEEEGRGGGEECLSCIELSTNYCVHLKKNDFLWAFCNFHFQCKEKLSHPENLYNK